MRGLLNNCIAHSNYQLGDRIYVNEFEDRLKFTNPGDFIPQEIENVLEASYSPPFYRNQLLADVLSDKQKEYKIGNLLAVLKKNSIIDTDSTYQQRSYWVLK